MTKIEFNKTHKITAFVMAVVLCFSAFLWIAPHVQAQELDISDTNVTGFVSPGMTRAMITDSSLSGGSIGVYVTSQNGDRYKAENVKWTYQNGSWGLDGTTKVLFEDNGASQQIAAYYPYNAALTDGVFKIELPEVYGENYEDYDYLYGQSAPLNANPATVSLNHLMSKVTVSVQSTGTEIEENDKVIGIALANLPRTADWTVPGAALSRYGLGESITLFNNEGTYTGYVLPNGASTLTVRITMESGRIFTATASLDDTNTTDAEVLSSGVHYNLGINVGKDKVEISTINVTDWTKVDLDAGVAMDVHVEYGLGDHIFDEDGKCYCGATAALIRTLDDLEAAIQNGGEYMLGDNIHVPKVLLIYTEFILHLNGKNLIGEVEYDDVALYCGPESNVTILGDGVLTNGGDIIILSGDIVNIAGGTFEGSVTQHLGTCEINGGQIKDMEVNGGTCTVNDGKIEFLWVTSTCTVSGGEIRTLKVELSNGCAIITGGWVENMYVAESTGATCSITGGSFGFDPTAYVDTTNYTVTEADGIWTVTAK